MHTRVLILSLIGANGVGMAVDHVPGLASQDECDKAVEKWKAGFDRASCLRTAVCVEQSGTTPELK
jgi:hypothetical protein